MKNGIQENNKLIAEFMGWQLWHSGPLSYYDGYDDVDSCDSPLENELEFDTLWDWLMPVVDKIELFADNRFEVQIQTDRCTIFDMIKEPENATSNYPIIVNEMLTGEKITSVYKAVVNFIEWYNERIVNERKKLFNNSQKSIK